MNNYICIIRFYGQRAEIERPLRFSGRTLSDAVALAEAMIRGYLLGAGFHSEIVSVRKDSGRADVITDEQLRKELFE